MKLKDGFVLRQVAGETVVIPSGSTLDLNMMITLNETGRFLWERLSEETDEAALVQALTAEYDVTEEQALSSVQAFLEKLNAYELTE